MSRNVVEQNVRASTKDSVTPRTPDTEHRSGIVFTLLSTFLYGTSNVAIRYLTSFEGIDHSWILFYKEIIGLTLLLPWLFLRWGQGRFRYTSYRLVFYLVIAAVLCECIGARFQVLGYDVIGLIIAVPLIQSSILLGVALLGHFIFGDSLSRRRKIAITILLVAVTLLSVGKELTVAGQSPNEETVKEAVDAGTFLLVAAGVVFGGFVVAGYIVIVRYVIRQHWADNNSTWLSFKFKHWIGHDHTKQLHIKQSEERFYSPFPVTLAMGIVLAVGVVYFGGLLYYKNGVSGFYNVPDAAWLAIFISGVCNLTGFFFQIQGLRMTSAVQASLITVSQMILLSLIGYFFFHEATNSLVMLGIGLAVYGVFMSARPEPSK